MGYDKKFRETVLGHVDAGKKQEEVRAMFSLGANTITQWKKLRDERGCLSNRPLDRNGRKINRAKLRADVKANPDDINSERAKRFNCTGEAIRQALKREKITRKKRV